VSRCVDPTHTERRPDGRCQGCRREAVRRWKKRNPQAHRDHNRRYAQAHPEQTLERVRLGAARRRARIAAATVVRFTAAQLEARLAYFGNRCWICGVEADQVDHVKPLAKRGPHMLSNLRPICGWCNKSKKDAWPVEHLNQDSAA
jgi:5-methylcytosine-specific restriction endonuclease McrA